MTQFVINLRQMIMNIKSVEMKKWMWCFHTSMLWHSWSKQKLHIFFLLSLRSWREWVRARNLRRSRERILLATCAAFCTHVRDRSSRGYPLLPATQAIFYCAQVFSIVLLLKFVLKSRNLKSLITSLKSHSAETWTNDTLNYKNLSSKG